MKTLAIFFSLITAVFARIGETPEQCAQRYGPPELEAQDGSIKYYQKNGINITVHFRDSVAISLDFSHDPQNLFDIATKLSEPQIEGLLKANATGGDWKPVVRDPASLYDLTSKKLIRADNLAVAYWDYTDGSLRIITIAEENLRKAAELEKKAQEKAAATKTTNGF
jgi:hypothetical protein